MCVSDEVMQCMSRYVSDVLLFFCIAFIPTISCDKVVVNFTVSMMNKSRQHFQQHRLTTSIRSGYYPMLILLHIPGKILKQRSPRFYDINILYADHNLKTKIFLLSKRNKIP